MSTTTLTQRPRFIIPVSEELREAVLDFAAENKMKVAELGRKLFEDYVKAEQRRRRHQELREACIAYADIVAEVQYEWRHTEVEGWPEYE